MKKFYLLVSTLFFLAILVPEGAKAEPFDTIFVFGDSLSDNGNVFNLTGGNFPPSPPYAQRFSNGPVAVEVLASNLGVSLAPSTLGGTNYAVGGAATGNYTVSLPQPPGGTLTTDNFITYAYNINLTGTGIDKQVAAFVQSPPSFDPAKSLFFVWGGANDFFLAPEQAVGTAPSRIQSFITDLADKGARYFFVPNLPDLSVTPYGLALSQQNQAALHLLSMAFDASLAGILNSLAETRPIEIIPFDTFSVVNYVIEHSQDFGLSNVTQQCVQNLNCLTDPNVANSYLFWDGVHPTSRGHQILGTLFENTILAAIPEPQTITLMVLGLIVLLFLGQRRALQDI